MQNSVADPGSGAFLTPGSGIREGEKIASESGIREGGEVGVGEPVRRLEGR